MAILRVKLPQNEFIYDGMVFDNQGLVVPDERVTEILTAAANNGVVLVSGAAPVLGSSRPLTLQDLATFIDQGTFKGDKGDQGDQGDQGLPGEVTLTDLNSGLSGKQPLDADLTAIAALDSSSSGALATDGTGWIRKTYSQLKTALSLTKSDVGLGNVDNTADTAKPISTATQTALNGKQVLDSDLTTIAALDSTTAGALVTDGAGWIRKTYAQLKTALALVKGDVGLGNVDNTSDVNKPISSPTSLYVQSRLQNLITNGSGLLGDNTNFSSWATFDATETHGGGGSFRHSGGYPGAKFGDEFIPVDPEKYYRLAGWAKAGDTGGGNYDSTNRQYFGIEPADADKLTISPSHYLKWPGSTDTTLAVQLNPGDTTVTLTDATGWHNGTTPYARIFSWWPYTNSKGYTYPNYTYSRYSSAAYNADWATNGSWLQGGISGNVITLRTSWAGPTLPAGTPVRNGSSGSSYKYIGLSNSSVPNAWTRYEGYIGTYDSTGIGDSNKFPYGTAYIRLLFLLNQNLVGGTSRIRWSDLWFSEMSGRNLELATASVPGVVTLGTGSAQASFGNHTHYGVNAPASPANGGTLTIDASLAPLARIDTTVAGFTLGVPSNGVTGQTLEVEIVPTVTFSLTIHASIVLTTNITSPISIAANKRAFLTLRNVGGSWFLLRVTQQT